MSLLHQDSAETIDSGLDIFTIPPTQTSIETGGYVEYFPLAVINQSTNIEFNILNKNGAEYIDLSNTYVSVRAKIVTNDGKVLPDIAKCAPINNWVHSLFSQIDISLNGTLVTSSENTYPYKAYLETLLTYDAEAKQSQLTAGMFYKDTAHKMDQLEGNVGMKQRQTRAAQSHEIDMIGRLHCDIMNMNRYLLNGVDVKLRLVKSKDAFNIFVPTTDQTSYKTVITHMSVFVRKCTLNPSALLAHSRVLSANVTAKYPLKRVSVRPYSIPAGSLSSTQDNLFLNQIPNRIIIGLVDSDTYNGHFQKNPFNFKHYGLNFISLYVNGNQHPRTPVQPNFNEKHFARSFYSLFSELGLANKNEGNGLDISEYDGGNTLYAFDLSPSILDGNQVELIKSGSVRIELKFDKALTQSVHVIVYAELDSMIEITKGREVVTDYTA